MMEGRKKSHGSWKSCVRAGKGEGWSVAGKSCVESRKWGWDGGEDRGMLWWLEGRRGGSEDIRHLVCLCVSKEILALTGVFFSSLE